MSESNPPGMWHLALFFCEYSQKEVQLSSSSLTGNGVFSWFSVTDSKMQGLGNNQSTRNINEATPENAPESIYESPWVDVGIMDHGLCKAWGGGSLPHPPTAAFFTIIHRDRMMGYLVRKSKVFCPHRQILLPLSYPFNYGDLPWWKIWGPQG